MLSDKEKIFDSDKMTRRERVEATLNHQPVDRVAIHEQVSFNPGVIEMFVEKKITGFDFTLDDVCAVIRATLDMCFPPGAPRGTGTVTTPDGFVMKHDNWTSWRVSRPFTDEHGARDWMLKRIRQLKAKGAGGDASRIEAAEISSGSNPREDYRRQFVGIQDRIGAAVLCKFSGTGFCSVFDAMGLEIYTFFADAYPEVLAEFMEISTANEVTRIHSVADVELSPVILIPEDFATKQGPIFSPDFLKKYHFPYVKRLTDAWHEHGIKVIYHSDGNYKVAIPELMGCGVDGFYCLEPACGMDVLELISLYPQMVWAGGLDGVDLMERGEPEDVRREVLRHIRESHVLQNGGMFLATSSEINPPVRPENFKAMIMAAGELTNPDFAEP